MNEKMIQVEKIYSRTIVCAVIFRVPVRYNGIEKCNMKQISFVSLNIGSTAAFFWLFIDDSFRKIIITRDIVQPYYDECGILTVNSYDFLLNPSCIDK